MRYVTIWDGCEVRQEPEAVARELISADKAQDMAKEDGLSLKHRHQFSGYATRELRASAPAGREAEPAKKEEQETEKPAVTWQDHKEAYKTATGAQRANQSRVEEWMRSEGIA